MFNFLSSLKHEYQNSQLQSIEDHIEKLKDYVRKCDETIYEESRKRDYYDDQIVIAMEKRLDIIDLLDEAATSSKKQRLA